MVRVLPSLPPSLPPSLLTSLSPFVPSLQAPSFIPSFAAVLGPEDAIDSLRVVVELTPYYYGIDFVCGSIDSMLSSSCFFDGA